MKNTSYTIARKPVAILWLQFFTLIVVFTFLLTGCDLNAILKKMSNQENVSAIISSYQAQTATTTVGQPIKITLSEANSDNVNADSFADVVKVFLMAGQSNMAGHNTRIPSLQTLICHANEGFENDEFICGSNAIGKAEITRLFLNPDEPVGDYQAALADFPDNPATQKLEQFLCTAGIISLNGQNCNTFDFDLTDRLFASISEYYYNQGQSPPGYDWDSNAFKQMIAAMGVAKIDGDGLLNENLLTERSDVTVLQHTAELTGNTLSFSELYGLLTAKFGSKPDRYGPELVFGHYIGDMLAEDVLLLKVVRGGSNLRVDWKTPCSIANTGNQLTAGELAQESIYDALVQRALDIQKPEVLETYFPQYAGKQIQIAGFVWFQGWNDGGNDINIENYETNLTCLINDLRSDLNLADLPVVIAQTHRGQPGGLLQISQANVAQNPQMEPIEMAITDDLSDYYHFDAAAHLVIGKRMAESMKLLISP
ncbi:MAG: sialate O-acetylesterase [Desulfobacteraceae bacterium]|nr:sialate O-acetylesterase [Desulfobacteraceae bacterium]